VSIPPIQTPPLPARLPLPLSPSPSSSPTPNHVFPLHDYPQRPPTPNMWHPGLLFPNTGSKLHFLSADLIRTAFAAANRGPGDRTVGYTGSELCLLAAVITSAYSNAVSTFTPIHDCTSEYRLRRSCCTHHPCCTAYVGLFSFLSVQSYLPILSS
jgi:hypothetical protein